MRGVGFLVEVINFEVELFKIKAFFGDCIFLFNISVTYLSITLFLGGDFFEDQDFYFSSSFFLFSW